MDEANGRLLAMAVVSGMLLVSSHGQHHAWCVRCEGVVYSTILQALSSKWAPAITVFNLPTLGEEADNLKSQPVFSLNPFIFHCLQITPWLV